MTVSGTTSSQMLVQGFSGPFPTQFCTSNQFQRLGAGLRFTKVDNTYDKNCRRCCFVTLSGGKSACGIVPHWYQALKNKGLPKVT